MITPSLLSLPLLRRKALASFEAGRWDEAKQLCTSWMATNSDNAAAFHLAGLVERRLGNSTLSVDLLSKAAQLNPRDASVLSNYGLALIDVGQPEQALEQFNTSLKLNSSQVQVRLNHAQLLRTMGRTLQAIDSYKLAIDLHPRFSRSYLGLANALYDLKRYDEAVPAYGHALFLEPGLTEAQSNLGNLLCDIGKHEDSINLLSKSLAAQPDSVATLISFGRVLREVGRDSEARECYKRALVIDPDNAELRWLSVASQLQQVYSTTEEMLLARKRFELLLDNFTKWCVTRGPQELERLIGVDQPYYLAYGEENNRDTLSKYGFLVSIWSERHKDSPPQSETLIQFRRIRVGIVSGHIFKHSVWHALIKGWLLNLSRQLIEPIVYSIGPITDAETVIAKSLVDRFIGGPRSLDDWSACIKRDSPDVLIFPEVGMDPLTLRIASRRLAKTQLASWGHPQTTGLPFIDYFITAGRLEPDSSDQHYTEKLLRLPGIGTYVEPYGVVPTEPSLTELGLDGRRLLLCPGTPYKYLPTHDHIYPEIVKGLGDVTLVFFLHRKRGLSNLLRERLRIEFYNQQVDFDKAVAFIPWQSTSCFFGFLCRATAMLDTIGFSGFNTALQAIECNCPIVAYEGDFLRGRLAAGLMREMGLNESVATTEEMFISLARQYSSDPDFRHKVSNSIIAKKAMIFNNRNPVTFLSAMLSKLG
jgi:protein O-GlcNAc transferase